MYRSRRLRCLYLLLLVGLALLLHDDDEVLLALLLELRHLRPHLL